MKNLNYRSSEVSSSFIFALSGSPEASNAAPEIGQREAFQIVNALSTGGEADLFENKAQMTALRAVLEGEGGDVSNAVKRLTRTANLYADNLSVRSRLVSSLTTFMAEVAEMEEGARAVAKHECAGECLSLDAEIQASLPVPAETVAAEAAPESFMPMPVQKPESPKAREARELAEAAVIEEAALLARRKELEGLQDKLAEAEATASNGGLDFREQAMAESEAIGLRTQVAELSDSLGIDSNPVQVAEAPIAQEAVIYEAPAPTEAEMTAQLEFVKGKLAASEAVASNSGLDARERAIAESDAMGLRTQVAELSDRLGTDPAPVQVAETNSVPTPRPGSPAEKEAADTEATNRKITELEARQLSAEERIVGGNMRGIDLAAAESTARTAGNQIAELKGYETGPSMLASAIDAIAGVATEVTGWPPAELNAGENVPDQTEQVIESTEVQKQQEFKEAFQQIWSPSTRTPESVLALQTMLKDGGYNDGGSDGIWGKGTRTGVQEYLNDVYDAGLDANGVNSANYQMAASEYLGVE